MTAKKQEQTPELDIFAEFATDVKLEVEGTWVPYKTALFKIARSTSPAYTKLLNKLVGENRLILDQNDEEADAISGKIFEQVLSETILLDWKGVSYQGKELTYSKSNAALLLTHTDFRRLVVRWSEDINNFKQKLVEGQLGN